MREREGGRGLVGRCTRGIAVLYIGMREGEREGGWWVGVLEPLLCYWDEREREGGWWVGVLEALLCYWDERERGRGLVGRCTRGIAVLLG